jgi:hypothetical protein
MNRRVRTSAVRLAWVAAGALVLVAPHARADFVASEAEERAQRVKIAKGYPADAAKEVAPYPGAKLDVQCSVNRWSGDTDAYAFRTTDPIEKVRAFYAANPPDPTRGRMYIIENACNGDNHVGVLIDLYPPAQVAKLRAAAAARLAEIERLKASPPDPMTLGQPLPPGATFDAECSVDAHAQRGRDFERIYCYRMDAATYDDVYKQLRKLDVFAGSWGNNVIVSIWEEPKPLRLRYQIGKGGPTKPLSERSAPAAQTASSSSSSSTAATPSTPATPAPAATPPPPKQDPVNAAKDTVNKLKGLFGR